MTPDLKACPFCGEKLHVRTGPNPRAHCQTEGCWANRSQAVVLDDPGQVSAWNRRAEGRPSPEGEEWAGYCKHCATARRAGPCHKCGGKLKPMHPSWDEPPIPAVEPIRSLAREVGYAIGVHGSLERDLDLIAAPWREDAVTATQLAEHIAAGINGRVLAPEEKPLGRWSCNIQIDGWFKLIDLSVAPALSPSPEAGREVRKIACDHCQRMTVVPALSPPAPEPGYEAEPGETL